MKHTLKILSITALLVSCGEHSFLDSATKYEYCVLVDKEICLLGPYESCASGGTPSNNCPYSSSSSSAAKSSSSSSVLSNYRTVSIGEQVWMAENLNGKLYDWATMMDLPSSCNEDKCASRVNTPYHQGICPEGWHIPSEEDWNELFRNIDGNWSDEGNSTWWTSNEHSGSNDYIVTMAYIRRINNTTRGSLEMKTKPFSVRCLRNEKLSLSSSSQQQSSGKGSKIADYKTVNIGGKEWMAENLYNAIEGSKCYNNELANCEKYGRLYDWPTAMRACPAGWHLPSNEDWDALYNYAGGSSIAGGKLKATNGWNEGGNGTDDFEFAALPGGNAFVNSSYFVYLGNSGFWWSSSENEENNNNAYYSSIYFNENAASNNAFSLKASFMISVRCVEDEYANCTAANNTKTRYCSNGEMRDYDFVQDAGGQTYKTVLINDQTWMAENLNYEVRNNSWCFENKESNCEKYGKLYRWATAMALPYKCNSTLSASDPDCAIDTPHHQGICPSGWHIPNYAEWEKLVCFVDGKDLASCGKKPSDPAYWFKSGTAGKILKSISGWDYFWNDGRGNGVDTYGFKALPGNYSDPDGNFEEFESSWWGSERSSNESYYIALETYHDDANIYIKSKEYLRSARCVKD